MNLITIDPGRDTGWAAFSNKSLVEARVIAKADLFEGTVHAGWALPYWMGLLPLVLIELPQHVKAPVMDLITLAVGVGEYKRFYESQGCVVQTVWPTTWKHSVPKEIHNQRVLAALRDAELDLLPKRPRSKKNSYDHNMLDAVGMGLWKVGRLR